MSIEVGGGVRSGGVRPAQWVSTGDLWDCRLAHPVSCRHAAGFGRVAVGIDARDGKVAVQVDGGQRTTALLWHGRWSSSVPAV
jgi:hypothetical protein